MDWRKRERYMHLTGIILLMFSDCWPWNLKRCSCLSLCLHQWFHSFHPAAHQSRTNGFREYFFVANPPNRNDFCMGNGSGERLGNSKRIRMPKNERSKLLWTEHDWNPRSEIIRYSRPCLWFTNLNWWINSVHGTPKCILTLVRSITESEWTVEKPCGGAFWLSVSIAIFQRIAN